MLVAAMPEGAVPEQAQIRHAPIHHQGLAARHSPVFRTVLLIVPVAIYFATLGHLLSGWPGGIFGVLIAAAVAVAGSRVP
ncbi:MAG: hypothetical protein K2Y05_04145, partial [Hyphomicrobiaceae bacterium]|nr:hypothetical protein [Hyphomicrobiaceae bacterium]